MKLIHNVPKIEVINVPNEKIHEMKLKEAVKKNDCMEWFRIIKTIYLKNQLRASQGKKISTTDTRYLHDAKECLYGELAIPLEIPKNEMEDFLFRSIEAADDKDIFSK